MTCIYDGEWWLACVLEVDAENGEVKVTFLHPHGPSRSFKYPFVLNILVIPTTDLLTKVNPRTTTGRVYTLTQRENKAAMAKFTAKTDIF